MTDRVRLLMVTNERSAGSEYGFRDAFEQMLDRQEIEAYEAVAPAITAAAEGQSAADEQLVEVARTTQPTVMLVLSPQALGHGPDLVRRVIEAAGRPTVLYWEGDSWHRWAKPVTAVMRAWLAQADIVFSVAREPQFSLLRNAGARDVQFVPQTYCQVQFGHIENGIGAPVEEIEYDAVIIGSRLAHFGLVSRVPGAAARASLVRRLVREDLRVAAYGIGWRGRTAMGTVPYGRQVEAIRGGLLSVNWDHFPTYEGYVSDRLPISLLAGRVHVTTAHRELGWLPGPDAGLFFEDTVSAVVQRVKRLAAMPADEVIALGAAAHDWVKQRLSDREAARYMLGTIDQGLLTGLPDEPWGRWISSA